MPIETTNLNFVIDFSQLPFDLIAKIVTLIFLVLYLFFSILVIRQVHLMTQTLKDPLSASLNLFAKIQLILTSVLLILAIFLM